MEKNNSIDENQEQQSEQQIQNIDNVVKEVDVEETSNDEVKNENVISAENIKRSEDMHISVQVFLKMSKPLMVVGWFSLIFGVGVFIILITSFLIGMQFVRIQEVKKGVLMIFLGAFTLGIWPYIEAKKLAKKNEVKYIDYDSLEFKKSMFKGYNIGFIIAITGGMTLLLVIGFFIIPIASYFIAIQHFREDRMFYGVFMFMFGATTLGIWPVFDSFIRRGRYKKEIMSMS